MIQKYFGFKDYDEVKNRFGNPADFPTEDEVLFASIEPDGFERPNYEDMVIVFLGHYDKRPWFDFGTSINGQPDTDEFSPDPVWPSFGMAIRHDVRKREYRKAIEAVLESTKPSV